MLVMYTSPGAPTFHSGSEATWATPDSPRNDLERVDTTAAIAHRAHQLGGKKPPHVQGRAFPWLGSKLSGVHERIGAWIRR
jgi:hypothetical protein